MGHIVWHLREKIDRLGNLCKMLRQRWRKKFQQRIAYKFGLR